MSQLENLKRKIYKGRYFIRELKTYLLRDYKKAKIIKDRKLIRQGDNSKEEIYIIRRSRPAGFFSNYFWALGHIKLAAENGWIPVVDMENCRTAYNEEHEVCGTLNAWEYYFEQPGGMTLKQAEETKQSIYCSSDNYIHGMVPSYGIWISEIPSVKKIDELKKYLPPIRADLVSEFMSETDRLQISECIGVHVRGTDRKYTASHPVPQPIEKVFAEIDRLFKKMGGGSQFIYVQTRYMLLSFLRKGIRMSEFLIHTGLRTESKESMWKRKRSREQTIDIYWARRFCGMCSVLHIAGV